MLCAHMYSFLLGTCLKAELICHMIVNSMFNSLEEPLNSSLTTAPCYIFTSHVWANTSLLTLDCIWHFDSSHCSGWELVFQCGFYLHFPDGYLCWIPFQQCAYWKFANFFEQCLFRYFTIFKLGYWPFYCVRVLYMFWTQVTSQIYD